jgi:putative acetyltransferase
MIRPRSFFLAVHRYYNRRGCGYNFDRDSLKEGMAAMMTIRDEQTADAAAIRSVHCAAFPTDAEARLVDRLRANGHARISLVAEVDGVVVGHVLFSPVSIVGNFADGAGLGLAPVAVLPSHQRMEIGSSLIREGLAACRHVGYRFIVLIGHPAYYPRFGFQKASLAGLRNEYGADEAFMVLELLPGSLPLGGGLVKYGTEFAEFE